MVQTVKNNLKRYFSVGPKSIFVVVLLSMASVLAIHNMRKTITVVIDEKETQLVTYRSDLKQALERNQIFVGPKDKIRPSIDSKVENGDKIYIRKAVNVEVAVDGKVLMIATSEDEIGKMLEDEGIAVDDMDTVQPVKTGTIEDGLKIVITRVEAKTFTEAVPIDFQTVVRKDDSFERTLTKVTQEGQRGEREISTKVIYENGKEVSRKVISDVIKKQPVQRILLQGTLGVLNLSRGGDKLLYRKSIRVRATAYTSYDPGVGTRTASGTTVRRNPKGYSTIAVDPRVIPLGTRVYVEGYGYAVAEDTGGAIKGNTIDVFMNTRSEAFNWGSRYVNLYILK